eukprot:754549-Hanusia_phi.AAC.1
MDMDPTGPSGVIPSRPISSYVMEDPAQDKETEELYALVAPGTIQSQMVALINTAKLMNDKKSYEYQNFKLLTDLDNLSKKVRELGTCLKDVDAGNIKRCLKSLKVIMECKINQNKGVHLPKALQIMIPLIQVVESNAKPTPCYIANQLDAIKANVPKDHEQSKRKRKERSERKKKEGGDKVSRRKLMPSIHHSVVPAIRKA